MAKEHEHVKILRELSSQFQPLFQNSPEGIYLYIDEVHKICNERLAKMFGLTVTEWEAMEGFVNKHAAEKDQEMIVRNYHEHIHQQLTPVRFRFKAVRKDGSTFNAETDMIPFPWGGEMLAFHFVREVK
ncbi:MAG: PAS domain S-box protein [Chloroflexi bacterium]|nr:PAS domain S-box protein [Chloroflexota bacterium]